MSGTRPPFWTGAGRTLSCLFALAALLAFALPPLPVLAAGGGDPYARLRPLFQFEPPPRRAAPRRSAKPQKAAPARKAPLAKARRPAVATVPKASDARLVLVAGDFFGQALAEGLNESFAADPSVRVENGGRVRSGLLRNDPAALLRLGERMPAAVVIMLGGNDRQAIGTASGRIPLRASGWNEAYGARAAALAQEAANRKIPLLWVGLPSVASARASSDFLAFNELYRASAEAGGGVFVDSWDGFVNEKGAFAAFGPDVDGQKARLRTRDGFGFTRAGRRKLAFFVAKPLAKLLDLPSGSASGAAEQAPLAGTLLRPGTTAPMPLGGFVPQEGADAELIGNPSTVAPAQPVNRNKLLYDPPAVSGRADNFLDPEGAAPAGP